MTEPTESPKGRPVSSKMSKITKKKSIGLEQDALFKQIGGHLDANFDYSQWQRTQKPVKKQSTVKIGLLGKSRKVFSIQCKLYLYFLFSK